MKSNVKKVATTIKQNNEREARVSLVEQLFYDFNRSRSQVYVMNFVRGVLFGAGSVIGGTLVIALLIWILTVLGAIIPPLGDFFESISHILENGTR